MIIAMLLLVYFIPLTLSPHGNVTRLFSYDDRDTLIAIMNDTIAMRIAKSNHSNRSQLTVLNKSSYQTAYLICTSTLIYLEIINKNVIMKYNKYLNLRK